MWSKAQHNSISLYSGGHSLLVTLNTLITVIAASLHTKSQWKWFNVDNNAKDTDMNIHFLITVHLFLYLKC